MVYQLKRGRKLWLKVAFAFGLLYSRRKLAVKSHFINTTAMNQGLKSAIDDAHQTLKSTKAKMRGILAQIEANQEDHGQPLDDRVSIVLI